MEEMPDWGMGKGRKGIGIRKRNVEGSQSWAELMLVSRESEWSCDSLTVRVLDAVISSTSASPETHGFEFYRINTSRDSKKILVESYSLTQTLSQHSTPSNFFDHGFRC